MNTIEHLTADADAPTTTAWDGDASDKPIFDVAQELDVEDLFDVYDDADEEEDEERGRDAR